MLGGLAADWVEVQAIKSFGGDMLFNSIDFLVFFPVVVLIYFIIPKRLRYIWLLVASYYFYMGWNAEYAILIGISTLITYVCGLCLGQLQKKERKNSLLWRRLVVALGVGSNLAILIFYKYFDFMLENINALRAVLGQTGLENRFDVILPVGISFYTFQALGYVIDVYRGDVEAEKNPLKYALFVSFFPQLVAGPIERSQNLLHQVNEVPRQKLLNYSRIANGLIVMIYGYFMKMVIADRIAIIVDEVFDHYWMYGTFELIFAAVCFSIQIYCDFGSYSIIAIGAAEVMGFTLMENFNAPYFAVNIKDFWRRWHISLSSWFRDYLYIPLGGNRKGQLRKYLNVMITFLLSGLWHGASWNYVVWGGLHGLYQVIGDALMPVRRKFAELTKMKTDCESYKLTQIFITFVMTTFAWIFFRAPSIDEAVGYIQRMGTRWNPWVLFDGSMYELGVNRFQMNILLVALVILFLVDIIRYKKDMRIDVFMEKQNIWFRWLFLLLLIVLIAVYGAYGHAYDAKQFIYFQF